MGSSTFNQQSFRGRQGDSQAITSSSFTFAVDTNFSQTVDVNFRVRMQWRDTNGAGSTTFAPTLRFSTTGETGTYTACSTSTAVKLSTSAQYANDVTPIGGPFCASGGTFINTGRGSSGGTLSSYSMGALTGRSYEGEWCLQLDSTQLGGVSTVHLRVYQGNSAMSAYGITPAITVTGLTSFVPAQNAYRFAEDGTAAGATLIGTLNTALSRNVDADSNLLLFVRIQETGGAAGASTDDYQLQRSINGAAFANVTTSSTGAKVNTASALTDGGATTSARLGTGTGSFVNGEQEEGDGLVDNIQLTASNYTEHVWALTLVSADLANADALTFRVLINGAVMTYNQTPTINVTKTAAAASLLFPPRAPAMTAMLVQ